MNVIVELQNFKEYSLLETLYFKSFYRSALTLLDEINN